MKKWKIYLSWTWTNSYFPLCDLYPAYMQHAVMAHISAEGLNIIEGSVNIWQYKLECADAVGIYKYLEKLTGHSKGHLSLHELIAVDYTWLTSFESECKNMMVDKMLQCGVVISWRSRELGSSKAYDSNALGKQWMINEATIVSVGPRDQIYDKQLADCIAIC